MNVVLCLFVLIAAAHGDNLREALKIIPDNLEGHSSPISNAEALSRSINKDKKCVPKPKYPNCFQICQICQICQSKLPASVDHENNEPHRSKREPATEESRLKDPTTNDAPYRINNTIWDIRRPSDSDMKDKNDIQWMFHRLFETIVETKVRFLILTNNSYFVKDIT